MAKTEKLGLHLSGTAEQDLNQTFRDWRLQMSGSGNDSNMELIDRACKQMDANIQNLGAQITSTRSELKSEIDGLTAADVGARPNNWLPKPSDIGAMPSSVTGGKSGNLVYLNGSGTLSDSGVSATTLASTTKTKMELSGTILYITTV